MLTVLFVNHVGQVSGAEMTLRDLIVSLPGDVRVVVACPGPADRGLAAMVREVGAQWHEIPAWRPHRWPPWRAIVDMSVAPRIAAAVQAVVEAVRPAVVHANSLAATLLLSRADLSVPILWQARDLRMPGPAARIAARAAASIAAISRCVAEALCCLAPASRQKIRVIYNGVDLARTDQVKPANLREELNIPDGCALVGTAAQLIPWKRLDVFLNAAALVTRSLDAHFIVAGADLFGEHSAYVARLRELEKRLGLAGRVHWLGYRPDNLAVLAGLDVYLHTADAEPLGRSLLEAMALGLPCVAPRAAGPAEVIVDGECGLLFAPGDPVAAAAATVRVLQHPALARRLGAAAARRVRREFDAARMAAEYAEIYRELAG